LDTAGKGRALAESGKLCFVAWQAGLAAAPWLAMTRAVATIPPRPPRPGTGAGVRTQGANRFHRPARRGASAASACIRGKAQWRVAAAAFVGDGVADLGVGVFAALDLVFFQKGFHCTIEYQIIFSSILKRIYGESYKIIS
jgi:hypothetical protein